MRNTAKSLDKTTRQTAELVWIQMMHDANLGIYDYKRQWCDNILLALILILVLHFASLRSMLRSLSLSLFDILLIDILLIDILGRLNTQYLALNTLSHWVPSTIIIALC